MLKDISQTTSVVASIAPIVGNNDTEGTGVGVDLRGYNAAMVVFEFGVSGDTLSGSVNVLPKVQHSNTFASGYTDVPAEDLVGVLTLIDDAAEDPDVQCVGYRGDRRYIRAFVDFTGTHTNGIPMSAVVVRGCPQVAPTPAA